MDLSFYPLTLEAIDQSSVEALCLFIAEDERPLTGLAGLADWRLSGKLSRLLRQGVLTGAAGEAVLTPPGSRLGFRKLFVFGMGPLAQTESGLVEQLAEALRKLALAGVQEAAMQLPARLSADVGIRTLIDELQGPTRALVFGADPQKLVTALSKAASSAAHLERRIVKVASPQKPPLPVAKTQPARPPPAIPKASPLLFAPLGLPASEVTPAPPVPIPWASPLPFVPAAAAPQTATPRPPPAAAAPLPSMPAPATSGPATTGPAATAMVPSVAAPIAPPAAAPIAPPVAAPIASPVAPPSRAAGAPRDAVPAKPAEPRPAPPPPQRYVPPPQKPHVFESGKGKGKKQR